VGGELIVFGVDGGEEVVVGYVVCD